MIKGNLSVVQDELKFLLHVPQVQFSFSFRSRLDTLHVHTHTIYSIYIYIHYMSLSFSLTFCSVSLSGLLSRSLSSQTCANHYRAHTTIQSAQRERRKVSLGAPRMANVSDRDRSPTRNDAPRCGKGEGLPRDRM